MQKNPIKKTVPTPKLIPPSWPLLFNSVIMKKKTNGKKTFWKYIRKIQNLKPTLKDPPLDYYTHTMTYISIFFNTKRKQETETKINAV